jgi:hypothetical protein
MEEKAFLERPLAQGGHPTPRCLRVLSRESGVLPFAKALARARGREQEHRASEQVHGGVYKVPFKFTSKLNRVLTRLGNAQLTPEDGSRSSAPKAVITLSQ